MRRRGDRPVVPTLVNIMMTSDLKPYPAYKDADVEWLGKVPTHWAELPLKRISRIDNSGHYGEEPENSECVLPVATTAQINKDGQFAVNDMPKRGFSHKDADRYRCHPGDILVVKSSGSIFNVISGKAGIVESTSPEFVFSNFLLRVVAYRGVVNPRFLFLLLSGHLTGERVKRMVSGSTYPNLRVGEYISALFPIPPIEEQTAIVRFLDHADRRIRRYIRAKQKLIALLEEQKQAIIHQAVTGQIDVRTGLPYPAYKPSGVEWLREVPEHWGGISLGAAADSVQTGPFGSQLHASDYVSGGIPVINPSHMRNSSIEPDPSISISQEKAEELSRHELTPGDIVMARRGEMGRCALVTEVEAGWLCGTGSLRIRPRSGIFVPTYLLLVLNAPGVRDTLSLSSIGATMDNLNAGMVSRLVLPKLPLPEQIAIVNFVDKWRTNIDDAFGCSRRQITLLQEYRTRLIADVVTGKLDVREAAAELPEVDPLAEDDLDGTIHDGENSNLGELDAEESAEEYTIEKEMPL